MLLPCLPSFLPCTCTHAHVPIPGARTQCVSAAGTLHLRIKHIHCAACVHKTGKVLFSNPSSSSVLGCICMRPSVQRKCRCRAEFRTLCIKIYNIFLTLYSLYRYYFIQPVIMLWLRTRTRHVLIARTHASRSRPSMGLLVTWTPKVKPTKAARER